MARCIFFILVGVVLYGCQGHKKGHVPKSLQETAKAHLQNALENSIEWKKVHAAEYILNLGYSNNVHDVFIVEERQKGREPFYRIGIWRVLYQSAQTQRKKNQWLDSISKAYRQYASVDRVHAAESLAKLKVSPNVISATVTDSILATDHNPLWAYTYWGTAYASETEMYKVKSALMDIILNSKEPTSIKRIALYAFSKMKNMSVKDWDLLVSRALKEPKDSPLYIPLLTCALANTPKDSLILPQVRQCREKLNEHIYASNRDQVASALSVYQHIATPKDLHFLKSFMQKGVDGDDVEMTMAAANAILSIGSERMDMDVNEIK